MRFLLSSLCFLGITLVLKTVGIDIFDLEWWLIMVLIIVNEMIYALFD